MSKKFEASVLGLTKLKCELAKDNARYSIINEREEGVKAFKINIFGLPIGFGPYDFKYFVEKKVPEKGGTNTFVVLCNYTFLFFIVPIKLTKEVGKYEPEFWVI